MRGVKRKGEGKGKLKEKKIKISLISVNFFSNSSSTLFPSYIGHGKHDNA